MLLAPLSHSLFVTAEHPLAGTWSVNKHAVKETLQSRTERIRTAGGYNGVSHPHPLQIGKQNIRPALHNLVAPQQSLSGKKGGNLR